VRFVALPDGSYVVEGDNEPTDVAELARLLEHEPPYRAEAVRREGSTWAVGMRSIHAVELSATVLGDELELVWDGHERSARVSGAPSLASVSELEALASARFDTWVVWAHRLKGAFWEVEVGPL
jgi:hypothetical protein